MSCRKKYTLLFSIILFTSCSAAHKAAQTPPVKISGKENRYYYYILSELKKAPETLEESEALLERALELDNNSSTLWAEKALIEARHSRWDEALKDAERSLAQDPGSVDSLILLGKLYAAKGETGEAIAQYKKALALDSTNESVYPVMAREYITMKSPAKAVQTLQQCLNVMPESMSCLYYLGALQLQNKNMPEALKVFTIISELHPNNPEVLQTISEIYLAQKNYTKALDALLQLKQLVPGDATSRMRLAIVYYELKQIDQAISEFERVIKNYPRSDRLHYYLGLLYDEKKESEKAIAHLSQIDPRSEFFPQSFGRLMYLLRKNKGPLATLEFLNTKIPVAQQTVEQLGLQASLLTDCGKYGDALRVIDTGLLRDAHQQRLILQRAIVLERLNRWDEAQVFLKQLIEQKYNLDGVYNYLGYTMIERGDNLDEAFKYVLQASQLKPKDGRITDSVGWAYFKQGDLAKAQKYLELANEQEPGQAEVMGHLAELNLAQDNIWGAKHFYEEALRLLKETSFRTFFEEQLLKTYTQRLKELHKKSR